MDPAPAELPVLLGPLKPPYPPRSRELGEEGTVMLAVLVGKRGHVEKCRVLRSSGYPLLDGEARWTAETRWRFRPGHKDGKAVAQWVRIPVGFRISDAR